MKGTIRFFLGLMILFGAAGGIEVSLNDAELMQAIAVAVVGLFVMKSGVDALKENA